MVSNAGYALFGAAEELSDEAITRQIDTNLLGSIQLIRAAIPYLREQKGGRLIQLSPMGGQIAYPGSSLYHATKWGIEGFLESVMTEVAPFGIDATIVEPGAARTRFGQSIDISQPIDAYADGPVGAMRPFVETPIGVTAQAPGDPAKMAAAIIESASTSPAPARLVLGTDSYEEMRAALNTRLAQLEASKTIAFSTNVDNK